MSKKKSRIKTVIGTFSQAKAGFGFVMPGEGEEDIFVKAKDTLDAMHGDIVEASIKDGRRGLKKEGVIVKILERSITSVVGTVERGKNFAFVIPDNSKIGKDIFIPKGKLGGAAHGQKVVVNILNYGGKGRKSPEGEVVEILGFMEDKGVDILSIAKAYNIPEAFPFEVIKEARNIPKSLEEDDYKGRLDLRDLFTVTIDGEDAKDLDDAVTLSFDGNVYTLGVHIADVSHYVTEGSLLNREALERGTSAYLIDRVIPMLPKRLSNGICSLNAGSDRLALSCIMTLDSTGNVIDHRIAETVINVDKRLSYTGVDKALTKGREAAVSNEENDLIFLMEEVAKLRIEIRRKRGAIDFDFPESKIILDKNGKPVVIKPYERNMATRIIEEFMLCANETVATDFFWRESPFVYRTHEAPDIEKMRELSVFINNFGYKVKSSGTVIHPKEVQKLLDEIKGENAENLISRLTLRSMKRAKYTVTADGHFGLASQYYCHFTSPIRRYPDLIIHRIIKETIHGLMDNDRINHYNSILSDIADASSRLERRAEEAEREVHKLKKAEYMKDHIGEIYEGVISGVTSWGIYVSLDNTIEGMVRISDMIDDDYVLYEDKYMMKGSYSGKEYALGMPVSIVVLRADTVTRTIDFMFEEGE